MAVSEGVMLGTPQNRAPATKPDTCDIKPENSNDETKAGSNVLQFEIKNGGGGENRTRVRKYWPISHYKFSTACLQLLAPAG